MKCYQDDDREESFVKIIKDISLAAKKKIQNIKSFPFRKDFIFSELSFDPPSSSQIFILHSKRDCLVEFGKTYIFCSLSNAPDFLEETDHFPGKKVTCMSQLMTPEVAQDFSDVLGPNALETLKVFLELEDRSRVRSFRVTYGLHDIPSPWMHFLLKPPEKKSGKKLYFASSLKETDGKPNILSSDLTEYVERINILISSLKIAKLIHSPSDAAAAGDAAATEA